MSAPQLRTGRASAQTYPGCTILSHESERPDTFVELGTIGADRMAELTGGLSPVRAMINEVAAMMTT